jgi:hypothetical protein
VEKRGVKVTVERKVWWSSGEMGGEGVSAVPRYLAGGGVVLAVREFKAYEPVLGEGGERPGGQRVERPPRACAADQ